MSDNRLSRPVRPGETPPFTSDPRDEYVYKIVGWVLAAVATVFCLAGCALVLLGLMFIDNSGPGTPLAQKVAYLVGGLSLLLGIGFALVRSSIPPPKRTYRSPHD